MRLVKNAFAAVAVLACALGGAQAQAQPYPSRDITFIVAFAPGGVADTLARFVAQGVSAKLGRNVVVENRGGAGGNIAAAAVARAAPDGYTVLVTTTALAINETLRKNNGFAVKDLKTIAIVASSPEALATAAAAILPPAPPLFSTTTLRPSLAETPCATKRAKVSATPPGANATMKVISRDG